MLQFAGVLLLGLTSTGVCLNATPQTASSNQRLASPHEAYKADLDLLERVRDDPANWSPIERSALSFAVKKAAAQCKLLSYTAFDGEELYNLARLCALGDVWPLAYSAASRYTHLEREHAANLASAYSILIQADLKLGNVGFLKDSLQEMCEQLGMNQETAEIFDAAIGGIHIAYPQIATQIINEYNKYLLRTLDTPSVGSFGPNGASIKIARNAALLEFLDEPQTGSDLIERIKSAPLVDQTNTELRNALRRFEALGHPPPSSLITRSSQSPQAPELLVLLPFPCVGCDHMKDAITALKKAHLRLTIVDVLSSASLSRPSSDSVQVKQGSRTITDSALSGGLGITDVPSVLVLDGKGLLRYVAPCNREWFNPNGVAALLMRKMNGFVQTQ